MAAAQGFTATSPDTRYGDDVYGQSANYATAQKFVCGGSGTQELSEIGGYFRWVTAPSDIVLAVFTHDAVNDCPESLVTNSDATITLASELPTKHSYAYETKPQVTGGDTYWLAYIAQGSHAISVFATSGELERAATYPTWPSGSAWETHAHYNYDLSLYAVYTVAGASPFVHPTGDIAASALRFDYTGHKFLG